MATIVSTRIARLQAVTPRATAAPDASGIVFSLSKASVSLPATSAGVVTSYVGASTNVTVFSGAADASSQWAYAKSDSLGVVSSLSGETLTVSSLTTDAAQVTITASRVGYPSMSRVFSLSRAKDGANGDKGAAGGPGSDGSRGSMTFYTSGSAWSDATANAAVTTTTGSATKVIGDTVTISSASFAATKYWGGTSWLAPGTVVDGNLLVKGTLSAAVINGGVLGGVTIDIGPGKFTVSSGGNVYTTIINAKEASFINVASATNPAMTATSANTQPAISAMAGTPTGNAIEAFGNVSVSNMLAAGKLKVTPVSTLPSASPAGQIVYNQSAGWLCFSNGSSWFKTNGEVVT